MTFDQLQDKWSSQTDRAQIAVDTAVLLEKIRKNKRDFERAIFWRDVREAGGSLVLALVLTYLSVKDKSWPIFVLALACCFVGAFMVIDRRLQKRKSGKYSQTLLSCAQLSLGQVNHQIWLLKNVFWWYLLPFSIGLASFFRPAHWKTVSFTSPREVISSVGVIVIWFLLYYGIYRLNQWVVKKGLSPRRSELEELIGNLTTNPPTADDCRL